MSHGGSPNDIEDSARAASTPLVAYQSSSQLSNLSSVPERYQSGWSINTQAQWAGQVQAILKRLDERASFTEAMHRKRSAKMLFVGAVSGLLGFLFAFAIGLILEQTSGKKNILGEPFPSGRGYFPATVSEMVHDPSQPAGKIFFAFCFVGALFIFFSWYPTQLRNVYIGDDAVVGCGVSWVTFRQFVPAPGMMLLSIVTTVPMAQATLTDLFCIGLHLTGAFMLFVGYFVAEAHAVGWGPWHSSLPRSLLRDSPKSIHRRKRCLTLIAFFYSIFCILQVVLSVPTWFGIPDDHLDQWGSYANHTGQFLTNTAQWDVKALKIISYGSEVICGVFLIVSHLVIWYYCEERHYDLPEELRALGHHFKGGLRSTSDEEDDADDVDSEDGESSD
mmetsp:Transcript_7614/g.19423  ORF Transcript_7614/g.19423 Transcript_7614/m.19423 type:complete len:390 (-) Transcript_7614:141-1310(-)